MGNTPSGEIDGKDKYIEEQKRIISEQQEQIKKLANLAENNETSKSNKPKIDPYKVLGVGKTYDESSLKKAYLSKALETHPDRGGTEEAFQKVTISYKALMIKLKNDMDSHIHNELRDNSSQFMEQQQNDNRQNVRYADLSKKFDTNTFNQIYNENRIEDVYDDGYSDWIQQTKSTNSVEHNSSLTKDNFNNEFAKKKQLDQKKIGDQMIKYDEPQVDISYKNKSSIMTLGQGKVTDFSGESGGLSYRDYKDAYTNTYLVGDEVVKDRPKDLKETEHQRKKISYEMSEKDQQIMALKKVKEEQEEKKRIERLSLYEEKAFNIYDQVHKRMIGQN